MNAGGTHIRVARPADAPAMLAIYTPFVRETAVSFEEEVPSVDELAGRVTRTLDDFPWLVAERGGELAGYAYATPHRGRAAYRWSTEVSVYVSPALRRLGIGRELYGRLCDILHELGYVNAYAGIALPNPASVGMHEACGFRAIGVYRGVGHKLGRWHDVGWWALDLCPREAEPVDPRPFSAIEIDRPG